MYEWMAMVLHVCTMIITYIHHIHQHVVLSFVVSTLLNPLVMLILSENPHYCIQIHTSIHAPVTLLYKYCVHLHTVAKLRRL